VPIRVQRQRVKGWKMPPDTVSVTRPGRWGNRFKVGEVVQRFSKEKICETFTIKTNAQAVAFYREYLEGHLANPPAAKIVRAGLEELRGKNLACFCALDQPCHADVLLELANSVTPAERSEQP
jgi:hypothetical protein